MTAGWKVLESFGHETQTPEARGQVRSVAAGVVAQTALGPIFLGGSVGESGHEKWFFQLGRVF